MSGASVIDSEVPVLFAEKPSSMLFCSQCKQVFSDPVLAVGCGHSFCRNCTAGLDKCPLDNKDFQAVVPNLSLLDHVSGLRIHCSYGVKLSSDTSSVLVTDPDGCPDIITLGTKEEHEKTCDYATVPCQRNSACPPIRKKDLEAHLDTCQKVYCPHEKYGCSYHGFESDLEDHLSVCPMEPVKEYLHQTDEQFKRLQIELERNRGELEFVKGALSSRVESLELLEQSHQKTIEELNQLKQENIQLNEHMEHLTDVVNTLAFQYQTLTQSQIFRCMGTFVGHQGPVWSLLVQGDLLYTGSSDKTIKVWHTGVEYKCIRTLEGHTDAVLCLTISGHRLFSSGKDNAIKEWSTETLDNSKTIKPAHDANQYVCALASNKKFLFSGSNGSAKIWSLSDLRMVHQCGGFNTWVRCLETRDDILYAGADVVKVISLTTFVELKTLTFPDANVHAYSLLEVENTLICGTGVGSIFVWNCETYAKIITLTGHTDRIDCLTALQAPNNGVWKVFSASNDRSIRVWRLDYKICTQSLVRHQGGVVALAVSKGRLFSGSVDTTVKVWVSGP